MKAVRTNTIVDGKRKIVFWKDGWSEEQVLKDGCEILKLPCGQCIGCRLEYSRQWAMRCALEAKQYKHNYFVTLTYDDAFVPLNDHAVCDKETGEVTEVTTSMTLLPSHLKEFVKRLRSRFRDQYDFIGIRFFACGEYGPLNMRPHYHLILFNCPLPDLVLDHYANGYTYYSSALLESVWKKGFVLVTDFSFDTAAYVARYMLKKHKGFDADFYEKNGIYPEFTRSSRRPGIGKEYLDENQDKIYNYDEIVISGGYGTPIRCKPPKYYDRLFDVDHPEEMASIKEARQSTAVNSMNIQLSKTDLTEQEYLQVKENNKTLSIKSLERSL